MFSINSEIKWNVNSLAVGFYTYILHTRIDVEMGDIIFVTYEKDGYHRLVPDAIEDCSFFELLGSIKKVPFNIDDLKEGAISLVFSQNDEMPPNVQNFCVHASRTSHEILFEFYNDFTYYQQINMQRYFLRVVKYTVEKGQCKLNEYSMLKDDEIFPILHAFDSTDRVFDENRLILQDFYNSYINSPNKECIVYKDKIYTYSDIEKQSNRIANMMHSAGIKPGDGIIIYMDRSEKILSSILAIMKCCGFYLPVDISTPKERVYNIIEDSKAFAVLLDNDGENFENGAIKKLNVNDIGNYDNSLMFPRKVAKKDDPCYMIYTSGTTGKPKGVMIRNRNIANFVSNNILTQMAKGIDRPCIVAPNKIGFDAFVGDMLLSVASGFKIVMSSSEELDNPHLFVQSLKRNKVNIIQTTPTRITMSILNYSPETLKRFKVIACGGEPLVNEIISKVMHYAPNATLINVYGPTETTVWSAEANVTANERGIGKPSQNTKCYVLNRYRKFVPNFETGILYIGGSGLGCYCFDANNQREKYIKVDGIPGEIYNSGDTAYLDDSNFIIYGARADSQVKINGVRIELSEIESVAKENPVIKECAVAVKEIPNLGRRLVLYYTADLTISPSEFQIMLSKLPAAYIPNFFVYMSSIPLTSSNKIDRKSLPMPIVDSGELVLPQTSLEKAIYSICSSIMPDKSFGIKTPLENIGFQSINMGTIIIGLNDLGYDISSEAYKIFNKSKNIETMAREIEKSYDSSETVLRFYPKKFFDDYTDISYNRTILLTGASGYLGAHVLAQLLALKDCRILCISHHSNIEERYNQYNMPVKYDKSRVSILYGSLENEDFGLSDDDYELAETADAIINCAALVKYFGAPDEFQKANVLSVKRLVDFAIKHNIVINHISTLSVLGSNSQNEISENDFWIEQNEIFDNQYVESKFIAEHEILKRTDERLKYRIIRVGRLSWRATDGVFQINKDGNEFMSLLQLFIQLKMVPQEALATSLEISPIEACASAIVHLCNQKYANGIFHVMNKNIVTLNFVVDSLNKLGYNIKIVNMKEFINKFNQIESDSLLKQVIQLCCIRNNQLIIEHNDAIVSNLTQNCLPKTFEWPAIDFEYFSEYFKK